MNSLQLKPHLFESISLKIETGKNYAFTIETSKNSALEIEISKILHCQLKYLKFCILNTARSQNSALTNEPLKILQSKLIKKNSLIHTPVESAMLKKNKNKLNILNTLNFTWKIKFKLNIIFWNPNL